MAEAFRDAGYATALYGKWHLGAAKTHGPLKQGFDEFFGIRGGFIDNYRHYSLHGSGRHDLYEGSQEVFRKGEYFMDMVSDRATDFISRNRHRPFFLYYPLNLPHYPEQAIEPYAGEFDKLNEPRRSYARIVGTTDHYIGVILRQLDRLNLTDQTLIMIAGDNGFSAEQYRISVDEHTSGLPKGHDYGANGGGGNIGKLRGSKGSFLEGGIRVPMVMRFPKSTRWSKTAGVVRDQMVTLLDCMPTALAVADIDSKIEFDGQDVSAIVRDNADSHYDLLHYAWQNSWMIRRGPWKLILNGSLGLFGQEKPEVHRLPKVFLGNLTEENPESINHAAARPDLVKQLTELHDQWARTVEPPQAECWSESAKEISQAKPPPKAVSVAPDASISGLGKTRVIFDTDICGDVDDVLALAMLHALADRGHCSIEAVTISRPHPLTVPMVDAINTFYGRGDIPIGLTSLAPPRDTKYLPIVKRTNGNRLLHPHNLMLGSDAPSAVDVLRRSLAMADDHSIVMVQVGLATNLAALLKSTADEFSSLSGMELVAQKVKSLQIMAGAFTPVDGDPAYREANVRNHIPPMIYLTNQWPEEVPIIWSDFQIGRSLRYPRESIRDDFNWRPNHIVRDAYLVHSGPDHDRPSWDLTSVLDAVWHERGYFKHSDPGRVVVDEVGATKFIPASDGDGFSRDRLLEIPKGGRQRIIDTLRMLVSQRPTLHSANAK
ncbi:MAG: sulfatase-like hydrolase/transferase, partial [Planctomycetota bacterium]